jgi:hypothetical protein|mmetsp:Transcript_47864/g.141384  ORF Transcript_47864/g.141384 Transcript_47864/m.141384 type:complete len:335 (+) Transcript_47864:94-1098(+)
MRSPMAPHPSLLLAVLSLAVVTQSGASRQLSIRQAKKKLPDTCIIAACATVAGREDAVGRAVQSMLHQTIRLDVIYVSRCDHYVRSDKYNAMRRSLVNMASVGNRSAANVWRDARVRVLNCTDQGPGTKLLCPLKHVQTDSTSCIHTSRSTIFAVFDDDRVYASWLLARVVDCIHGAVPGVQHACSPMTYIVAANQTTANQTGLQHGSVATNLSVGQGADVFAFVANPELYHLPAYVECVTARLPLVLYHDDVWLSAYLRLRMNMTITRVKLGIHEHPYAPVPVPSATASSPLVRTSLVAARGQYRRRNVNREIRTALRNRTFHACVRRPYTVP